MPDTRKIAKNSSEFCVVEAAAAPDSCGAISPVIQTAIGMASR